MSPQNLLQQQAILRREIFLAASKRLKPLGIGRKQSQIIRAIHASGSITPSELGKKIPGDRASLSRSLGSLVEQNIIERERSEEDRRIVNLRLTAFGETLVPQMIDTFNEIAEACFSEIGTEEQAQLYRIIQKVIESARRESHK